MSFLNGVYCVTPVGPNRLIALILLAPALVAAAPAVSGEAVYKERCAGCHETDNPRIPHRDVLEKLPATRILRTLDYGVMIAIAYPMTRGEREAVASYLGSAGAAVEFPPKAFCADRAVRVAASPRVQWNGWSPDLANTRFQPAAASGLTLDGVRHLKLKWAFAFDGDTTAFDQPTVLDGNLFTGSAGGVLYALDPATGCVRWTFDGAGPVRTSIVATPNGAGRVLLFGDQNGWFYALDAATGRLRWKKHVDEHDAARLTGAAVAQDGVVYVPVASWEENRALKSDYPCCTARGSVVALRIRDGAQVWKTYMVSEPKEIGKTSAGVAQMGPSGAGIWSAPTLDPKRKVLYVTTGDNYSAPATETSDAVVAVDLKSGRMVWSRQFLANDIFSGGCASRNPVCGPDYDFGSSAILVTSGSRQLLVAGQKSGVVYALDPDRKGEIVWQTRVGKGSTNGGVEWGMATDGQKVYAAVSDIVRAPVKDHDIADLRTTNLDPQQGGGLTALRLEDGSQVWRTPAPHACDPPKPGCSPAQPAAVTAAWPGVIFSGSVDGHLRAYSAEDGAILWDFDTAREFETVNGVKGHGGSIDGPGAVVVNGMVFVNSGYARQNGMPGNVLLAFE
jgi:polyvinyl alcohol dehydrogenase (cytochrome)